MDLEQALTEALDNPSTTNKISDNKPRVLIWDTENSPAVGEFWGDPWKARINRILKPSQIICFAAKWLDDDEVFYFSTFNDGYDEMVKAAWILLNEADGVISYNGKNHDSPKINTEFITSGLGPPSPYKEIDLYQVVRSKFSFHWNKLDYVSTELGIGSKLAHEGYGLWVACGENDENAWSKMRDYNEQDVLLTEKLYRECLPYIPQHMLPHPKVYNVLLGDACGRCGGEDVYRESDWYAYTPLGRYLRYLCRDCRSWLRGAKLINKIDLRGI